MKYLVYTILIFSFFACSKTPAEIAEENDLEIQEYIDRNGIENVIKSNSGLYYTIEEEGNGVFPSATDAVKVIYKGYLTDDNVFDQGTIDINLQQVIRGWTEGIQYYSEGGSGQLFIPAHLGYGDSESASIPANSVLIFDINLIEVK